MKIYGASPALISRFRFLLLLFFFFCKRAYDKQRGGGLLEKHRIRIPRWKRRMHVTTSYVPFLHLFFHKSFGSTKSNLEHRTRVPSLTIISSVDVVPDAVTRGKQYFRGNGICGELVRKKARDCTSDARITSINSFVTNSDGNSYG